MIHCTATQEGRPVTGEELHRWFTLPPPKGRGWKKEGYVDIFHLDGRIENRIEYDHDEWVQGSEISNGALGMNSYVRHGSYVGGVERYNPKIAKDTRTREQRHALEVWVWDLIYRHPDIQILGHNQVAAKACPSFFVPDWLREIKVPEKHIWKGEAGIASIGGFESLDFSPFDFDPEAIALQLP